MNISDQALRLLNEWSWEPSVVVGTALCAVAYLGVVGPLRSRFVGAAGVPLQKVFWFLSGLGIVLFALVSPIDAIGDQYLFSAHMLQHMLLLMVAPPMLLMGTPGWAVQPFLRDPVIRRMVKTFSAPAPAFLLFNVNLFLWHIPWLYEATLQNETVHILEHLTFIATGVVNWMPLLSPLPEVPRLAPAGRLVYLIADMVPSVILGLLIVSAPNVLYPTYATAPRIFALDARGDQILGGLMMEMPIGMLFMGAVLNPR